MAAFATGVPPDIYAFHHYTRSSMSLSGPLSPPVFAPLSQLSQELSAQTERTACGRFTPSNSGQRSSPTYYRGCWHVVSRGLFPRYRPSSSLGKAVYTPKSVLLHAALLHQGCPHCGKFLTAASRRSLGRSQSQCGCSSSQTSYRSQPW